MSLPAPLALDLRGRSLTRIRDWTAAELDAVLDLADELKAAREPQRLLDGRTLGLLFRKHSTRTRVSLEVAAAHLGATALYLPGEQLQLARGESIEPAELVEVADRLWGWIREHFGSDCLVRPEWPVGFREENGTVVFGTSDLIIETRDHLAIVDHKSYGLAAAGAKVEVLAGQLAEW